VRTNSPLTSDAPGPPATNPPPPEAAVSTKDTVLLSITSPANPQASAAPKKVHWEHVK
jgi:hypothetical protein